MAQRISEWIMKFRDNGVAGKLNTIGKSSAMANRSMDRGVTSSQRLSSSYSGLAGTVRHLVGAFALLQGAKRIGRLAIEAEQAQISFEVMLGSAQKAQGLIKEIREFGARTPFQVTDLQNSAKLLLNFGLTADKVMPTISMLGDVSQANRQRFQQLSLAYSQVRSAGRLMGQDLLQLINAGFNPLQEISEHTGIAVKHLRDEMSKGNISFAMVEQSFKRATSEGGKFFNMMQRQGETVGGRITTMQDEFNARLRELGFILLPLIRNVVDFTIALLRNRELLGRMATILGVVVGLWATYHTGVLLSMAATKTMAIVMGVANGAVALFTGGFRALNMVMRANPVGIVLTAITALVGGIIWAWNKFEGFRMVVMGLWETFKQVFTNIATFFKRIFAPIGEAIAAIREGRYGDAAKAVGKQLFNLNPVGMAIQATRFAREGGFQKGVKEAYARGAEKGKTAKIDLDRLFGGGLGSAGEASGAAAAAKGVGFNAGSGGGAAPSGIGAVSGGGKNIRNVTVNIDSLVNGLTVQASTIREGVGEIREIVIEELVRAVSGGEQILSNG